MTCHHCDQQTDNDGQLCARHACEALVYPWGTIACDLDGIPVDPDPPGSWEPEEEQ